MTENNDDSLNIKNEEIRTVRESQREMSTLLRQLADGDMEKIVLFSRGQMLGVLLSPAEYTRLKRSG